MSAEAEQTKLLREILKWIKISGIKEVKSLLEMQLDDDPKRLIYQLSDSTKGTQEIAKIVTNVSYSTVSIYWKQWEKVGLGESIPAKGGSRFKRSFDLEDFGFKIQIPKQNADQKSEQPEATSTQSEVGSE